MEMQLALIFIAWAPVYGAYSLSTALSFSHPPATPREQESL